MAADLLDPIFTDEAAARKHFEAIRWPGGPTCPFCGQGETVAPLGGASMGPGWYHCRACRQKFTALVGTIYHRSHIPLHKWLLATHLMCASKKGMSAHQLHRMLGVTNKTAWFMAMRIREAMRDLHMDFGPLGGENKVVEADETYIGGKAKNRKNHIPPKEAAFSLVEREGRVRSHHVPSVNAATLKPILKEQIDKRTHIITDESPVYPPITGEFAGHSTVNHSIEEYVRGGGFFHTNNAESYFSILKRGIIGTYHHVSPQHLKRYLGEFDFRYNERTKLGVSDAERAAKAVRGVIGKRMTYKQPRGQQAAAQG